jgi:hypothetical protein
MFIHNNCRRPRFIGALYHLSYRASYPDKYKSPVLQSFVYGGIDGVRTRDLLRDRQAF